MWLKGCSLYRAATLRKKFQRPIRTMKKNTTSLIERGVLGSMMYLFWAGVRRSRCRCGVFAVVFEWDEMGRRRATPMGEVNARRRKMLPGKVAVVSSVRAHSQVEDCKKQITVVQGVCDGLCCRGWAAREAF